MTSGEIPNGTWAHKPRLLCAVFAKNTSPVRVLVIPPLMYQQKQSSHASLPSHESLSTFAQTAALGRFVAVRRAVPQLSEKGERANYVE